MRRPKLEAFIPIIDQWLDRDRTVPRKQRHTAKRVFDRLRDEQGFAGGYTIIKDYMRDRKRRGQEMFVPLVHPAGHGQADFGEAVVVIGSVEQKAHSFVLDLPHSDACYVRAHPAGIPKAFGLIASRLPDDVPFYHWSDIDPDGIWIFRTVERTFSSRLLPHLMTVELAEELGSPPTHVPGRFAKADGSILVELIAYLSKPVQNIWSRRNSILRSRTNRKHSELTVPQFPSASQSASSAI